MGASQLPPTYREQPACATCRHCIDLLDGWYCNRNEDRADYPDSFDYLHDGTDDAEYNRLFQAAVDWELAHSVRGWAVCDEHAPAPPVRSAERGEG